MQDSVAVKALFRRLVLEHLAKRGSETLPNVTDILYVLGTAHQWDEPQERRVRSALRSLGEDGLVIAHKGRSDHRVGYTATMAGRRVSAMNDNAYTQGLREGKRGYGQGRT